MIELKLTPLKFKELLIRGYSLEGLYLMSMLKDGYIIEEIFGDVPKITNIGQSLIRKGLVTTEGMITEEGENILNFLFSVDESSKLARRKKLISPVIEDDFTKWWKIYPATNTFEYKGKKFEGDRALKVKKGDCKVKLEKILAEKEYTINELIGALKLEISQKCESSIKTKTNKMSFFQNSLTYLNQCTYEPFIELVRAGHKPEEITNKTISKETYI